MPKVTLTSSPDTDRLVTENSSLVLTDDGTNQVLTGNLGYLQHIAGSYHLFGDYNSIFSALGSLLGPGSIVSSSDGSINYLNLQSGNGINEYIINYSNTSVYSESNPLVYVSRTCTQDEVTDINVGIMAQYCHIDYNSNSYDDVVIHCDDALNTSAVLKVYGNNLVGAYLGEGVINIYNTANREAIGVSDSSLICTNLNADLWDSLHCEGANFTQIGDMMYYTGTSMDVIPGNVGTQIQFLAQTGDGIGSGQPVWTNVDENAIILSNITTNDASTTQHGFCPLLSNDGTQYLDGLGGWTTPVIDRLTSSIVETTTLILTDYETTFTRLFPPYGSQTRTDQKIAGDHGALELDSGWTGIQNGSLDFRENNNIKIGTCVESDLQTIIDQFLIDGLQIHSTTTSAGSGVSLVVTNNNDIPCFDFWNINYDATGSSTAFINPMSYICRRTTAGQTGPEYDNTGLLSRWLWTDYGVNEWNCFNIWTNSNNTSYVLEIYGDNLLDNSGAGVAHIYNTATRPAFSVADATYVCPNLNADMLDGVHSAGFVANPCYVPVLIDKLGDGAGGFRTDNVPLIVRTSPPVGGFADEGLLMDVGIMYDGSPSLYSSLTVYSNSANNVGYPSVKIWGSDLGNNDGVLYISNNSTSPAINCASPNTVCTSLNADLLDGKHLGYLRQVTKTATYTAELTDDIIVCNKTTAMTINLPAAFNGGTGGKVFYIKNVNTGIVTVQADGAETIDDSNTQTLNQYEAITITDYASGKWCIV